MSGAEYLHEHLAHYVNLYDSMHVGIGSPQANVVIYMGKCVSVVTVSRPIALALESA